MYSVAFVHSQGFFVYRFAVCGRSFRRTNIRFKCLNYAILQALNNILENLKKRLKF